VVFTLDVNEWNGERSLQLRVCDVRLSETNAAITNATTVTLGERTAPAAKAAV
jgi:hypothetical protein